MSQLKGVPAHALRRGDTVHGEMWFTEEDVLDGVERMKAWANARHYADARAMPISDDEWQELARACLGMSVYGHPVGEGVASGPRVSNGPELESAAPSPAEHLRSAIRDVLSSTAGLSKWQGDEIDELAARIIARAGVSH